MSQDRLEGWHAIADYLGVGTRTAQKWEKERRLPVRRLGAGAKPRVFARAEELEQWREDQSSVSTKQPHQWRNPAMMAALLLASLVAILFIWSSKPGNPVSADIAAHELRVIDETNTVLWTREFPEVGASSDEVLAHRVVVADIYGDSHNEILFAPPLQPGESESLYCYRSSGELLWTYPADEWLNGIPTIPGSYGIHDVIGAVSDGRQTFVALTTKHKVEAPARVVLLDPGNGRVVDEYWHPGHLYNYLKANLDDDSGDELILTGYNNPRALGHPAAVVLNVPFNKPDENPHAKENYYGPWNAREYDYLLFPRIPVLTVNRVKTGAKDLFFDGDMIVIRTIGGPPGVHAFYYFDQKLEHLLRYRPADPMLSHHRSLYNNGILATDATPQEIKRWARIKRFLTAPDGDDPRVAKAVESSSEIANSIHTGRTAPGSKTLTPAPGRVGSPSAEVSGGDEPAR